MTHDGAVVWTYARDGVVPYFCHIEACIQWLHCKGTIHPIHVLAEKNAAERAVLMNNVSSMRGTCNTTSEVTYDGGDWKGRYVGWGADIAWTAHVAEISWEYTSIDTGCGECKGRENKWKVEHRGS